MDFGELLLTAFGLVLVFEGLVYGLLAGWMKRWLPAMIESVSEDQLRWGGLAMAALGVVIIWLLRG
jgi:uncharacterized protein YjeT (DUF2065 family)